MAEGRKFVDKFQRVLNACRAEFIQPNNPPSTIPSVRELAFQWGTSTKTVVRVLRTLKDEGVLVQDSRNGRYHPKSTVPRPEAAPKRPPQSAVVRVAEARYVFILGGEYFIYGRPPLTIAEVRRRFGCAYKTAAGSLKILMSQEIVKRQGRGRVGIGLGTKGSGRRVVVTGLPRITVNPLYLQMLTEIEEGLQDLGWPNAHYHFADVNSHPKPFDPEQVAGYVFIFHEICSKEGFIPWRIHPQIPTVVIDPAASDTFDFSSEGADTLILLKPDNHRAGVKIAAHLGSLGHRRIAFVSHIPFNVSWVAGRLRGLKKHMETFLGGSVEQYLIPEKVAELQAYSRECGKHIRTLQRQLLSPPGNEHYVPERYFSHNFRQPVYRVREMVELSLLAVPALSRILADPSITACVCANDKLALIAQDYFSRMKIGVPKDISICGFDNSPESRIHRISSFDMNFGGMGRAAPRHLAFRRDQASFVTRTIPGRLVIRDSLGSAPDSGIRKI